jgi:hypothetical protein
VLLLHTSYCIQSTLSSGVHPPDVHNPHKYIRCSYSIHIHRCSYSAYSTGVHTHDTRQMISLHTHYVFIFYTFNRCSCSTYSLDVYTPDTYQAFILQTLNRYSYSTIHILTRCSNSIHQPGDRTLNPHSLFILHTHRRSNSTKHTQQVFIFHSLSRSSKLRTLSG